MVSANDNRAGSGALPGWLIRFRRAMSTAALFQPGELDEDDERQEHPAGEPECSLAIFLWT
jgi:hypothetical protein